VIEVDHIVITLFGQSRFVGSRPIYTIHYILYTIRRSVTDDG
jgi:hypothetical protein